METNKRFDVINVILLIIGIFTIYFQVFPPTTQGDQIKSFLYFLASLGYIFLNYAIEWIRNTVNVYVTQIKQNREELDALKEQLNMQKNIYHIKERIKILEVLFREKKGNSNIDYFRWIGLAGALVLFYLYLRSLGIVP